MLKRALLTTTAAFVVSLSLTNLSLTAYAKVSLPDYLYEHYEKQPECVKTSFETDNWDLELAEGYELNRLYGQGDFYNNGYDISGVTVYDIKTIYLSDFTGYAEVSLNHEMGHFVDYSYYTYYGIQPSTTDEFYYIYNVEANKSYLYEDYELSDISEYFAQSYWSYVEDPDDLRLFYPMTYSYIDNIVYGIDAAVANGFNRIYDDKCFMMGGERISSVPQSTSYAVKYNEETKKINIKNIPILKEIITRIKIN